MVEDANENNPGHIMVQQLLLIEIRCLSLQMISKDFKYCLMTMKCNLCHRQIKIDFDIMTIVIWETLSFMLWEVKLTIQIILSNEAQSLILLT